MHRRFVRRCGGEVTRDTEELFFRAAAETDERIARQALADLANWPGYFDQLILVLAFRANGVFLKLREQFVGCE